MSKNPGNQDFLDFWQNGIGCEADIF